MRKTPIKVCKLPVAKEPTLYSSNMTNSNDLENKGHKRAKKVWKSITSFVEVPYNVFRKCRHQRQWKALNRADFVISQ